MPVAPNMKNALLDNRVTAIRNEHKQLGIARAQLDLSGGIDSAVMAGILVMALGPDNVTLAHTNIHTNPEQTARAKRLADGLGCRLAIGDFTEAYEAIVNEMRRSLSKAGYSIEEIDELVAKDKTVLGSIRSTLRAPLGRGYNRLTGGGLRHGTGNECEDRYLRFYQKGGDGEVDSNPIAMLSKGEVYQLAWFLAKRFPKAASSYKEIIQAVPSPDLWGEGDGHSDETELLAWTGAPFTYSRIDASTGEYTYVGTIERVSRFLDMTFTNQVDGRSTGEKMLFAEVPIDDMSYVVEQASKSGLFDGFTHKEIETLLIAARRIERITRHKLNPNCPCYGSRDELVEEGILTNDLPDIPKDGFQSKALIVVDMLNDFGPGGALSVPGAEDIVEPINNLMRTGGYDTIVLVQDWHPADHGSFAVNTKRGINVGDVFYLNGLEQVAWPVHCVQGTKGAEFMAGLDTKRASLIIRKGMDPEVDSYSAFCDNGGKNPTGLTGYLKSRGIEVVDVCGVATDYCVKFTALDSLKAGFKTRIMLKGCRGVQLNEDDSVKAVNEMMAAGISAI
jgi:nicotinamidase-related amidase/NH3-dependent NAD+ synthetase